MGSPMSSGSLTDLLSQNDTIQFRSPVDLFKMPSNIRVYLDVIIGNKTGGRIVFELFDDAAPMAVENFRGLCTGEYGDSRTSGLPLSFKGCRFFRIVPGFIAQCGDFECNNGDGGESIYGGTFKDESFLRRHAQAGVLSMANNGRHTNGSQFFVTLKRAPQLDGKHVVFGQLVQGMEVLRAIEKCPIDGSNMPRVPIQIVDCGELGKLPAVRRSDPKFQMRESVATLMASLNVPSEQPARVTDAQIGAEALQKALKEATKEPPAESSKRPREVPADVFVRESEGRESEGRELEGRELEGREFEGREFESEENDRSILSKKRRTSEDQRISGVVEEVLDLNDERQKKLYELRLRLNQSRRLNAKEVSEEAKAQRQKDPKIKALIAKRELKETLKEFDRTALHNEEELVSDEEADEKSKVKEMPNIDDRQYLNETADAIQWKDYRQRKKKSNAEKSFGWNAINPESHFRGHKKRTRDLKLQSKEYANQLLQLGEDFYNPTAALVSAEFKPSEEAKERLAQETENQKEKRKKFSRRRMYIEEENVGYINEFNRSFNKKLERAYGAQSVEIRQNLERGTAL